MKGFIFLLTLSLFCMLSCSNDTPECTSGTVEISDLESMGCPNATHLIKLTSLNEFELIRTQQQFDEIIETTCQLSIDWEKFDLIVGMARLSNGVVRIEKELVKDCIRNRANLTFAIYLNETQVAPEVSFNAVIPKLENAEGIFVEVKTSF